MTAIPDQNEAVKYPSRGISIVTSRIKSAFSQTSLCDARPDRSCWSDIHVDVMSASKL